MPDLIHPEIQDRALNLLCTLGDNPNDIASRLAQEECFGEAGDCYRCPLAVFLNRFVGQMAGYTPHWGAAMCAYLVIGGSMVLRLSLSAAQQSFISQFDIGRYPFLERRPW